MFIHLRPFLVCFWAILIIYDQEMWVQTEMSSQNHQRNGELPVQEEMKALDLLNVKIEKLEEAYGGCLYQEK